MAQAMATAGFSDLTTFIVSLAYELINWGAF